jgi:Tol biopolymer transport system component
MLIRELSALALVLALGVLLPPAALAVGAGETQQVSVTRYGTDPPEESSGAAISADGRYVAFDSEAPHLVAGDNNRWQDVFVRDLVTGTTVQASVAAQGGDAGGDSYDPSISSDGRYVAFVSEADNIVPHGTDRSEASIFVRDSVAGTTILASVGNGYEAEHGSWNPAISGDGRFVAFESEEPGFVPRDGNSANDIFVRDLQLGLITRATVSHEGRDANSDSWGASLSSDGRFVAFYSNAHNLVENNRNELWDIYVRDMFTSSTTLVSVDARGGSSDGFSSQPSISADGRYVAFASWVSNLVRGDGNGEFDIFRRDLLAGTTIRVSVDWAGGDPDGESFAPSISSDGSVVAFYSWATDLVAGDSNGSPDIYVRNLVAGTTTRVSVDAGGGDADGPSMYPALSGDGLLIGFQSWATDLLPTPTDPELDVFAASSA